MTDIDRQLLDLLHLGTDDHHLYSKIISEIYRGHFTASRNLLEFKDDEQKIMHLLLMLLIEVRSMSGGLKHQNQVILNDLNTKLQTSLNQLTGENQIIQLLGYLSHCLSDEIDALLKRDLRVQRTLEEATQKVKNSISVSEVRDSLNNSKDAISSFILGYINKYLIQFTNYTTHRDQLIDDLKISLKIFSDQQNQPEEVIALRNIGVQYSILANSELAEKYFTDALSLASQLDQPLEIFGLLNNLGVVSRRQANYDTAIHYYNKALQFTEKSNFKEYKSLIYNNLGTIFYFKNNLLKALEHYKLAYNSLRKNTTSKIRASTLDNIGEIYFKMGEYDRALEYYNQGLYIRYELEIDQDIATSLDNIGLIYRDRGEIKKAEKVFLKGLEYRQHLRNHPGVANSYDNLSEIYLIQGNYQDAIRYREKTSEIWKTNGNTIEQIKSYFNILLVYIDHRTEIAGSQLRIQELMEVIQEKFNQFKERGETPPRELEHIIKLIEIMQYYLSERSRDRFFALKMLKDLIPQLNYDFNILYRFSLLQAKLLLFELLIFFDDDTKTDLWDMLNQLKEKAKEQHAIPKIYQLGLFEAELYLLNLDIEATERILIQIALNTEESGLIALNMKINRFYLNFLDKKDELLSLRAKNPVMKEIIKQSDIGTTLEKLTDPEIYEQPIETTYRPKMIMIVELESGLPIHAKNLDPAFSMNEALIGALLSAISTFMREAFHTTSGLHRIDYGGNIALFAQEGNILFCHLLSGSPEEGLIRLLQFKAKIVNNKSLWHEIRNFQSRIYPHVLDKLNLVFNQFFSEVDNKNRSQEDNRYLV